MSDAYRDMWLAEMGAVCREVPREERAVERAIAQARTENTQVMQKSVHRRAS